MMLEGHGSEVYSCKFSPGEGDLFASAGHDRSIFLWRTWGECENFATLTGHKNAILELHWSNDGERIISASPDKTVRAWDLAKGVQVKKMNEHSDAVNSCAYMRRGSNPLVVSGGDDRQIKVRAPCLCALQCSPAPICVQCAWLCGRAQCVCMLMCMRQLMEPTCRMCVRGVPEPACLILLLSVFTFLWCACH